MQCMRLALINLAFELKLVLKTQTHDYLWLKFSVAQVSEHVILFTGCHFLFGSKMHDLLNFLIFHQNSETLRNIHYARILYLSLVLITCIHVSVQRKYY